MMTGLWLALNLVGAALVARFGGGARWAARWWLLYGVAALNPLLEAVVFGVMKPGDTVMPLGVHAAVTGVGALGMWWLVRDEAGAGGLRTQWWRWVVVAGSYVVLYFVAGMLVFPFVREFYATKTLPSIGLLVPLQVVRGLLYAGYAAPWLARAGAGRPWVLGYVFAVVGGVAQLLLDDNPYMPREVRYPHMVEVGCSNFVFGWLVARVLGRR
jgi:hypothetical protein